MSICNSQALLIALRNRLEHNPAVVYKGAYVGETLSLLKDAGWDAECLDLDIDRASLTDLIAMFLRRPAVILLWTEVHQARLAKQIAATAKKVSPESRIFVFGRATAFIPQYFERDPFDAVHVDGDREAAIKGYVDFLKDGSSEVPGVSRRAAGGLDFLRSPGRWLAPELWPLPTMRQESLNLYREFTMREHGPVYSHRLSVTVSKGCEYGCAYCGAPIEEGKTDRRRPLKKIFDWVEAQKLDLSKTILHLYSPTLFADQTWVSGFCHEYALRNAAFEWRGVTTVASLSDKSLVELAGANGCREIAVGIETLFPSKNRTAKSSLLELEAAIENTQVAGIKLKGLVMLGYPGQHETDVINLENFADKWNIELRYTGYTPLYKLKYLNCQQLDAIDLERYDRRTYFDGDKCSISNTFFYKTITRDGGYYRPVSVMPEWQLEEIDN